MARLDKAVARYAKAIFDSYHADAEAMRKLVTELTGFAKLVTENKELHQVFTTRVFSDKQRQLIVGDLSAKLKLSDPALRVLSVLVAMRRVGSLSAIVDRLRQLILEAADIVPLRVEAAGTLTADQKDKLEGKFSKLLGKKVEANYQVDPSLIGGVRVTARGRTFDGTLSGWLSAFETQLAGSAAR